jgi:hypothetical protein
MTSRITLLGAVLGAFACGVAAVHAVQAQARPPAYTIAEIEVTEPATFQKYGEATGQHSRGGWAVHRPRR